MSAQARISVITVVRNGADSLEETILSVLESKSAADIDYIVIDGSSTDGTVDIIRKYADRIAYWVSEPDKGIYDAMNKGWAAAVDDSFILYLGAGDRLISLPKDMEHYCRNDVVCGQVFMGDGKLFIPKLGSQLKLYNSLHHQALLVNKGCYPKAPFNTAYSIYADFDFNQRLMISGARFTYCPQLVSYAHPGGVSDQQRFAESLKVIWSNFGVWWVLLALWGYAAIRVFPLLNRLRPFQKV